MRSSQERSSQELRINGAIRARFVLVIDQEGKPLGKMSIRDALGIAQRAQLDLVEVAPDAPVPVCKVLDFGKYRYNLSKREKKQPSTSKMKEVKLKPGTDDNDLKTKARKARAFLEKGHKVRVVCVYRGREMVHLDVGKEKVKLFLATVGDDVAEVIVPPQMTGRMLSLTLSPLSKKGSK